jgi:NDP-sugar pyrophosphorylase family protein
VIDTLQKNDGWGSTVFISDEQDELLDTGGGLLKAKPFFIPGEPFLTCNVDILTDLDINKLIAFHNNNKPLVSFGITDRKTSRYMLFDKDDRLCGWRNTKTGEEKIPLAHKNLVEKAYSCVVMFEYGIFDQINFTGKFSLIDVYLDIAARQKVLGYDHTGNRWVDVGRVESVEVAESLFP